MTTTLLESMLDPTAEASPSMRERLAPPADLTGKTIALLSIGKERSAEFLDYLADELVARGHTVRRVAKPTHTKRAPENVLQDIVEHCDVVVEALAD
jgi:hypothetical protein